MKCFSMFSGIGGFDLALQNLGHEIVGACEIDRYAREIYGKTFPKHPQSTMMPRRCRQSHSHHLTCFVVDSLVRLSPLLAKDWDLMIPEALSFLKLQGLLKKKSHAIYSLKTFGACYFTTKGKQCEQSSESLMKWGMMRNGRLLTAKILFHKTGNVSSLSDILEEQVPDKYFLSETAVKSILEHDKRHKENGNRILR